MPPPRYGRPATPAPTVPPPEPPSERLVKRISTWKVLGAILGVCFAGGAAFAMWKGDLVTRADLAAEHAGAAQPVLTLQIETQALRERMARVETAVVRMQDDIAFLRAQLVEVAKTVGARAVPPPSPAAPP